MPKVMKKKPGINLKKKIKKFVKRLVLPGRKEVEIQKVRGQKKKAEAGTDIDKFFRDVGPK